MIVKLPRCVRSQEYILLLIAHEYWIFGINGHFVDVWEFVVPELYDDRIGLDPLHGGTWLRVIDEHLQIDRRVLAGVEWVCIRVVVVDSQMHLNILWGVGLGLEHRHGGINDEGTVKISHASITLWCIIRLLSFGIVARLAHTWSIIIFDIIIVTVTLLAVDSMVLILVALHVYFALAVILGVVGGVLHWVAIVVAYTFTQLVAMTRAHPKPIDIADWLIALIHAHRLAKMVVECIDETIAQCWVVRNDVQLWVDAYCSGPQCRIHHKCLCPIQSVCYIRAPDADEHSSRGVPVVEHCRWLVWLDWAIHCA